MESTDVSCLHFWREGGEGGVATNGGNPGIVAFGGILQEDAMPPEVAGGEEEVEEAEGGIHATSAGHLVPFPVFWLSGRGIRYPVLV